MAHGVTALRLLKPGRVGINFNWARGADCSPGWLRHPMLRPVYGLPPHYDLLSEDGEAVTDLFAATAGRKRSRRYDLALRRFEGTYEKLDYEDRLIDHWIGLEALFGGGKSEISYRICLRIAALLAEGGHRTELFRQMRESYEARSRIVHGSRAKVDLRNVLSSTEGILRLALRTALQPDWPRDVEQMDALVLGG